MSNLTLDRPTVSRPTSVRLDSAAPAAVGSYVDTHGVRRATAKVGSYAGSATVVGSFTGRRPGVVGSYVGSER